MDTILYIAIVLSFATFVTTHLSLALGLTFRRPRWRGPLGFVVPPLAPYWGFREGLRVRSALWILAVGAYAAALTAGHVL